MINLDEFLNWLKINTSSENTSLAYYFQMKAFFKFSNNEINQDLINKYFLYIIEHSKSASKFNLTRYAFKRWFDFSKTTFDIPKKRKSDKRLIENFITEKDLEEILNDVPRIFQNPFQVEVVLKVLFYTGLRKSELINLKRSDVDLEKCKITLRNTKNNNDAIIFFPKSLRPSIIAYFTKEREITGAFNVSVGNLNDWFLKINTQLKPKVKLHPHSFRRSYAKHAILKTGDILGVQKQLRHSNLSTTQLYSERTEAEQAEWYHKNFK